MLVVYSVKYYRKDSNFIRWYKNMKDNEFINDGKKKKNSLNLEGFTAFQTMGFVASLATIGLAVFGIVFHFMTR